MGSLGLNLKSYKIQNLEGGGLEVQSFPTDPGVVTHSHNPSTQEVDYGGSEVQGRAIHGV